MRTRHPSPLAACAVLISLSAPLAAQDAGFGARSGVALGGLRGLEGADARPGVALGPTFAAPINSWLAIQAELLYTSYGAWLNDVVAIQASDAPFSLASFRYIQAPILARLDVGKLVGAPVQALLYGGPHVSARLTCQLDIASPLAEPVPCGSAPESSPFAHMRTFEVGAVTGASLAMELFSLFQLAADVRYQHGFSRFGPLDGGVRQGIWAFAIRLSGTDGGAAPAGYVEPPVPPAIQTGPLVPQWWRSPPPRGVRM